MQHSKKTLFNYLNIIKMKTRKLKFPMLALALAACSFGLYLFLQPEELVEMEECDCERPVEEIPFFNIP